MAKKVTFDIYFVGADGRPTKTPPKLDVTNIPRAALTPACPILRDMIRKAMANPQMRREFEEWRAGRGDLNAT